VQEWQGSDGSVSKTARGYHTHATPRQFLASRHPIRQAVELGHDWMGEHGSALRYELVTPAGPLHVSFMVRERLSVGSDRIHAVFATRPHECGHYQQDSISRMLYKAVP
jgi:hypothetical protein